MTTFDLSGRVFAVTGATRGIGRALAIGLAGAGADVVLIGRSPADDTAAAIAAGGRRAAHVALDLASVDEAAAARAIDQSRAAFGRLDGLVNNAGIVGRGPFLAASEALIREVLEVDLIAPMLLSQAVARRLIEQGEGGRIISIASLLAFQGGRNIPAYATAKHGLAGMTKALANEIAPHGITVNAIAPGYIATDINAELREDPEQMAALTARIPAGHWGSPDDLVGATVFLASAAAAYVTGSVLVVDGGWLAR